MGRGGGVLVGEGVMAAFPAETAMIVAAVTTIPSVPLVDVVLVTGASIHISLAYSLNFLKRRLTEIYACLIRSAIGGERVKMDELSLLERWVHG